jgi:hypothetical protein
MTTSISRFAGDHAFLSNFYVEADGLSGEHRFQAAKTLDPIQHARVLAQPTPGAAKGAGRHVVLRSDWEQVKVAVMTDVVTEKFASLPLRELLLSTDDAVLVEGNTWGDVFWGVDARTGAGRNVLGQILMEVRQAIRDEVTASAQEAAEPIVRFTGDYRFLSNFWPIPGETSVEHIYQAAKAASDEDRDRILALPTPGEAKRAGQEVAMRSDWDDVRIQTMAAALGIKFCDPKLRQLLLATGERYLAEGNTWGDVFWGIDSVTGDGRNVLGILLMGVRSTLRAAEQA